MRLQSPGSSKAKRSLTFTIVQYQRPAGASAPGLATSAPGLAGAGSGAETAASAAPLVVEPRLSLPSAGAAADTSGLGSDVADTPQSAKLPEELSDDAPALGFTRSRSVSFTTCNGGASAAEKDGAAAPGEGDGLGSVYFERLSQTAPGVRQRARSEHDSAGVGAAESGGSLTGTCPCSRSAACSQYVDRALC